MYIQGRFPPQPHALTPDFTHRQLYEVLAHKSVTGMRIPVLLAANKADAGVRSHTVDFIRKRLEKELCVPYPFAGFSCFLRPENLGGQMGDVYFLY